MSDVYEALRLKFDSLSTGYPATQTGIEMKILKRMYRSLLYEGGKAWMGCWREETMANMARDERATERIHRSIIEHRRSAAL